MPQHDSNRFTYRSHAQRVDNYSGSGRAVGITPAPFEILLDDGAGVTKKLTAELIFIGTMPKGTVGSSWEDQEHYAYLGMLTFGGRRLVSPYNTGTGIPVHSSDQAQSFIHSLTIDSTEETFDRWADDYGYDTDSVKAREMWEACVTTELRLRTLLGNPYHSRFVELVESWDL